MIANKNVALPQAKNKKTTKRSRDRPTAIGCELGSSRTCHSSSSTGSTSRKQARTGPATASRCHSASTSESTLTVAGSAANTRLMPVSALSQARVIGSPARPNISRPEVEAGVGARRKQCRRRRGRQRTRPGPIRYGEDRAPHRSGRVDDDAGQQPPPCDEIRRRAPELGDVRERRAPYRALGVRLAQHAEQEVSVELQHGHLPLAGRHCSGGSVELIPHQLWRGDRPSARVGKVTVTVDAVALRAGEASTAKRSSCAAANGCAWTRGFLPGLRGSTAGAEESSPQIPSWPGSAVPPFIQPGSQQAWITNTALLFAQSGKTASQHASPVWRRLYGPRIWLC